MRLQEQTHEPEYHRSLFHSITFWIWRLTVTFFAVAIIVESFLQQVDTPASILWIAFPVVILAGVEHFVDSTAANPLIGSKTTYRLGQFAYFVGIVGLLVMIFGSHEFLHLVWVATTAIGWFLIGRRNMNDHKIFQAKVRDEPLYQERYRQD